MLVHLCVFAFYYSFVHLHRCIGMCTLCVYVRTYVCTNVCTHVQNKFTGVYCTYIYIYIHVNLLCMYVYVQDMHVA